MSIKTKAGQIWTDSVAYVALLTGAGLSIAGNVANVLRTRGDAADTLDIVLAVAFPGLVVLMVEVFVSARWRGLPWPMQVLRWVGTLSIGAVAMRVSWTHLHELMSARGQTADVATLGPLAIDCLAIMATALILAGRGQVARPLVATPVHLPPYESAVLAEHAARQTSTVATWTDDGHGHEAQDCAEPTVADEAQHYLARLSATLDSTTTAAHPVSPAPLSNAVKPESVPADAADLIMAWATADPTERPAVGQADQLVAAAMSREPRTARRWRKALLPADAS